jgi:putative oxidoreductase
MLDQLFAPLTGLGELVLRLTVGIVFLPHGWQKMKGPSGFAGFLRQLGVPVPLFFAWTVALLESAGAVLLIPGILTRPIALGLAADMLVAIVSVRIRMAKAPFASTPQVTGWEFEFALLGASMALVFTGAGRCGLDRFLGL